MKRFQMGLRNSSPWQAPRKGSCLQAQGLQESSGKALITLPAYLLSVRSLRSADFWMVGTSQYEGQTHIGMLNANKMGH